MLSVRIPNPLYFFPCVCILCVFSFCFVHCFQSGVLLYRRCSKHVYFLFFFSDIHVIILMPVLSQKLNFQVDYNRTREYSITF